MSLLDFPSDEVQRRLAQPALDFTYFNLPKPRFHGTSMAGYVGDGRLIDEDRKPAQAGNYRIKVSVWAELVSKPGEAKKFVEHRRGDVVKLTQADAERLFSCGAVEAV